MKLSDAKKRKLISEFGDIVDNWYPQLQDKLIEKKKNQYLGCQNFFSEYYKLSIVKNAWVEFEDFLRQYNNELKNSRVSSQQAESMLENKINVLLSKLKYEARIYLNNRLSEEKNNYLSLKTESKSFTSKLLGNINYEINITVFNQNSFDKLAEDAYNENWKYNSLYTGATPWSFCYGSYNSCNYNCSQIQVSSGNSDVIVIVKNSAGNIIRHCYIKQEDNYTFHLPDGSYTVFFYSGSGWNPEKTMPSSECYTLKGGFVSDEDVSKDDFVYLSSNILTYRLTKQISGNFSAKGSSLNEAL